MSCGGLFRRGPLGPICAFRGAFKTRRPPICGICRRARLGSTRARAGGAMWSRSLVLALLLLPAPALAGAKERIAALAPSALVLAVDAKGTELVAQHVDQPFVPASVTK